MNFHEFCRIAGLIPPQFIEPGRWMRCPTEDHPRSRNGALKLAADGETGWAQNHGTMSEVAQWWRDDATMPAVTPEALRARLDSATRNRIDSEARATAEARSHWMAAKPLHGGHGYLERKRLGMEGCHGLKLDNRGRILVPMYSPKYQLLSLQSIAPDGEKRFWLGAPVAGCSYILQRSSATITVLCEGLATGLTIFVACPNASVVVCFNASNMVTVAKSRRWQGLVVIAGDNDEDTCERIGRNPGVLAAKEAALVIGCGVAIPLSCGDWNDCHCAQLAKIEEEEKKLAFVPHPLAQQARAMMAVRFSITRNAKYIAP